MKYKNDLIEDGFVDAGKMEINSSYRGRVYLTVRCGNISKSTNRIFIKFGIVILHYIS